MMSFLEDVPRCARNDKSSRTQRGMSFLAPRALCHSERSEEHPSRCSVALVIPSAAKRASLTVLSSACHSERSEESEGTINQTFKEIPIRFFLIDVVMQ